MESEALRCVFVDMSTSLYYFRPLWPTIALYLPKLESLTLITSYISPYLLKRPSLCDLRTSNLRKLYLDYTSASTDFANAFSASPQLFDRLEHLRLRVSEGLPPVLPPNLQKFYAQGPGRIACVDLDAYIPNSVTSLKFTGTIKKLVGEFGPNLQALMIHLKSFRDNLPALPASLTSLTISEHYTGNYQDQAWHGPDISHLISLTKLRVRGVHPWPHSRLATLPPALQSVYLESCYGPPINLLTCSPPSLTTVHLRNTTATTEFSFPGLKNLTLAGLLIDPASFFPKHPHLQYLKVHAANMPAGFMQHLPRTLLGLACKSLLDHMLPHLPPRLRSLESLESQVNIESWKHFPSSLTVLSLGKLSSNSLAPCFHLLPPRLREFRTPRDNAVWLLAQSFWDITSAIETTSIYCQASTDFAKYEKWRSTHLNMRALTIHCRHVSPPPLMLSYLPISLRTLDISRVVELHNEHFKALPRCLTTLTVSPPFDSTPTNFTVDNAGMAMLPRTLRLAHLPTLPEVTAECLPRLPPLLWTLNFSGTAPPWFESRDLRELGQLTELW